MPRYFGLHSSASAGFDVLGFFAPIISSQTQSYKIAGEFSWDESSSHGMLFRQTVFTKQLGLVNSLATDRSFFNFESCDSYYTSRSNRLRAWPARSIKRFFFREYSGPAHLYSVANHLRWQTIFQLESCGLLLTSIHYQTIVLLKINWIILSHNTIDLLLAHMVY